MLALQIANPSLEQLDHDSKEALHLQSMIRMVRDKFRATTDLMRNGILGVIPLVATCVLSRAAAIMMQVGGRQVLNEEDHLELQMNLRRFGARWTVARMLQPHLIIDPILTNPSDIY
jgi:hypothetical protein